MNEILEKYSLCIQLAEKKNKAPSLTSMMFTGKDTRPIDKFQLTFPLRTNYMYAKAKRSLPEMYTFSVCLWIKSSASPGVGTPFSYAVPGQANELVLIEWGNNPMELLINDKVRTNLSSKTNIFSVSLLPL